MKRDTLIIIPCRMASTRLPGKPLAEIDGLAMICQVLARAREADIGTPWVATDSEEVMAVVKEFGGKCVMTRADHPSGSDRIWEAVEKIDPQKQAKYIINLQGDLPSIDPSLITACLNPLLEGSASIATLGVEITQADEKTDPNVVKIIGTKTGSNRLRALYFTRATAPWGEGPLYHHIGIYAYRREALGQFVNLPPSPLEQREKLEQLRAIEAGMEIEVAIVNSTPIGVDTPKDLDAARQWFSDQRKNS